MNSKRSENLLNEIDIIFKDIEGFKITDELKNSYLAKFLTVFICGLFEEAIENIITERITKQSSAEAVSAIDSYLHESFTIPKFENILKMLSRFNELWSEKLKEMPKVAIHALDSIVHHKNSIAHGWISDITIDEIKDFYLRARMIIEKIDKLVLDSVDVPIKEII